MYSLGIYTLGCKVNQYESEAIAEAAKAAGFEIKPPSSPCDVYIINTCTVTAESDRKSRQFIRRAIAANPSARIIVTGCLSQVSSDTVAAIDGVDYITGSRNKSDTVKVALELVNRPKPSSPVLDLPPLSARGFEKMTIKEFPRTRAYIKIEDGCESHCSYCIIPEARGKIVSKPKDDVMREVSTLIDGGCREIVLTGIETAAYGKDLDGYRLADLLADVDRIAAGHTRIRLGSLDPSLMRPEFVEKIAPLSSLAPHFHLSMQSGCDKILALMKRRYNTSMAFSNIENLRSAIPGVEFTTDVITGFPGETEEDFAETVGFFEKVGFLDAHVFPYSRRAGTVADSMPGQLKMSVKRERAVKLIEIQRSITRRKLDALVGSRQTVLFETFKDGYCTGHTPSFVGIKVKSPVSLHAETFTVTVTGRENETLTGEIIPDRNCDKE